MPELEKQLKDEDVEIRREAVESLRGKAGTVYVNLLLNAMEDMSWRVRHSATDILLEEHPVEAYIHGLINLLYRDENAGARNSSIEALVKLNRKATPFLLEAFNTPNKDVRKFIIDVLGEFRDDRSLSLMLNALKDDDENVRVTAIEHIGKVGDSSVVEALIGIIENGDLWTSYPAVDALGRIGDRQAVPALIKALGSKPLRAAAVKSLGRIGDPASLAYVVPFIEDSSKTIQEETLRSMERFYRKGVSEELITDEIKKLIGDRILDILISYAISQKPEVKISAILILGLLKDERAFAPLLEISQEEEFAEDVKRAFVFIGNDRPESLLKLFDTENTNQKRFICEVAGRIASPVYYPVFEKFLYDEDGHIRSLAAIALSRIQDARAIEKLKILLADPYEDVQEAAVEALSGFGPLLSVAELVSLLHDVNPTLRKNAALLLGNIGAKDAVPDLGFTLKDGNVDVRKACIQAFSRLRTEDSIRFLMLALTDEDPYIRVSSAISLGRTGGEGVFEALSLLISDSDDSVRVAIAKALGMLKDKRAVNLLMELLSDRNGFVVTTTIESLSRINGDRAKSALLQMLEHNDREVRRTAIKALSSFDDVEGELLPFLKDGDWATRKAAAEALGKNPQGAVKKELERLLDSEEDPIVKKVVEDSLKKHSMVVGQ
ncbi:MAG: HEAT repeat domain-containing protein [Thermodesulfovibrionales bacterium]